MTVAQDEIGHAHDNYCMLNSGITRIFIFMFPFGIPLTDFVTF